MRDYAGMAAERKIETYEERSDRLRAEARQEAHTLAHLVSPMAGNELLDGSPEREEKQKVAKRGSSRK